jgi:hypothetical protein
MLRQDWTNRKGAALSLLLCALGFAVADLPSPSTRVRLITPFLAVAGIVVLILDWFIGRRAIAATRPNLSACATLITSKDVQEFKDLGYLFRLLLSVTNEGAPATLWASIEIKGQLVQAVGSDLRAVWNRDLTPECKITTGDKQNIRIADSRVEPDLEYYWFVPFVSNGKVSEAHARGASMPNQPHPGGRIQVSVTVFSDPPSLSPQIKCEFSLDGCDQVTLMGVSLCPGGLAEGSRVLESPL